jgi:hypothetical protein
MNGANAHNLGVQLVEKFYEWVLGYSKGAWQYFYTYNPCLEPFQHSSNIRKDIDSAIEFYKENNTKSKHEIVQLLTSNKVI